MEQVQEELSKEEQQAMTELAQNVDKLDVEEVSIDDTSEQKKITPEQIEQMMEINEKNMNVLLNHDRNYSLSVCVSKMELLVKVLRFRAQISKKNTLIDSTKLRTLLPKHLKHLNILEEADRIKNKTSKLTTRERYLVGGLAAIREFCIVDRVAKYSSVAGADTVTPPVEPELDFSSDEENQELGVTQPYEEVQEEVLHEENNPII